jgi:hypothetical protein
VRIVLTTGTKPAEVLPGAGRRAGGGRRGGLASDASAARNASATLSRTPIWRVRCICLHVAPYTSILLLTMSGPMPQATATASSRPEDIPAHIRPLNDACVKAIKDPASFPYWSTAAIECMHSEFARRNPGQELWPWQGLVGEVMLLHLDCTVIAGTNAGKTTPTISTLLAAPPGEKRVVLMLSPLKML